MLYHMVEIPLCISSTFEMDALSSTKRRQVCQKRVRGVTRERSRAACPGYCPRGQFHTRIESELTERAGESDFLETRMFVARL